MADIGEMIIFGIGIVILLGMATSISYKLEMATSTMVIINIFITMVWIAIIKKIFD